MRRTLADAGVILLLIATVVAVSAHAPSDLYAYAQLWQAGAAVDVLTHGGSHVLLPQIQTGAIYHKPPLYPWLTAGAIRLLGSSDFVFRLPTVVAAAATALLVYALGRRWYGRRTGLLAACLWATTLHMSRMAYLATTDMLLTLWITVAMLCADRLLLHPSRRRGVWAVGLWAAMILAALSKGWGLVNLVLVGGFVALAAAVAPGFGEVRRRRGVSGKVGLLLRAVARRWWRAARTVHLGWGLLAMAAVMGPLWAAMLAVGGQSFREVVYFEVVQRLTGEGPHPPRATSTPPALHLLYYTLPASLFAVGALLLRLPRWAHLRRLRGGRGQVAAAAVGLWLRRCFRGNAPTAVPLCWVLAVVVPFSLAHGFRPDYLLPCYAAVALLGAWAVGRLERVGPARGRPGSMLRHAFAAAPLAVALLGVLAPAAYLLHHRLPGSLAEEVPLPPYVAAETWILAGVCIAAGAVCMGLVIRSSLRWRLRRLAGVSVVAMIVLIGVYTHFFSRHARTGDGEKMIRFARRARQRVRGEAFLAFRVEKLGVEPLLGRFGELVRPELTAGDLAAEETARRSLERINAASPPWLFVSDRGLLEIGAAEPRSDGAFRIHLPAGKRRFVMRPGELGRVVLRSRPVVYQEWGRAYLIRIERPVRASGEPVDTGYITGYPEAEE